MKKALAILVVLGLAALANAAFSDNFNADTPGPAATNMTGWTMVQQDPAVASTLYDQGGGDIALEKVGGTTIWNIASASVGDPLTGVITFSAAFACLDSNPYRPAGIGVVDATGKGVILGVTEDNSTQLGVGPSVTSNGGVSFTAMVESLQNVVVPASNQENTIKLTIDLSTGAYTEYINTTSKTGTIALPTGMGAVTNVILCAKKQIVFDDVNVTPEPATMAMLALGGLGMLIRRKR